MNLKGIGKIERSFRFSHENHSKYDLECIHTAAITKHHTSRRTHKKHTFKTNLKGSQIFVMWYGIALNRALNAESAEIVAQLIHEKHTYLRTAHERKEEMIQANDVKMCGKCQWNWYGFWRSTARITKTTTTTHSTRKKKYSSLRTR